MTSAEFRDYTAINSFIPYIQHNFAPVSQTMTSQQYFHYDFQTSSCETGAKLGCMCGTRIMVLKINKFDKNRNVYEVATVLIFY